MIINVFPKKPFEALQFTGENLIPAMGFIKDLGGSSVSKDPNTRLITVYLNGLGLTAEPNDWIVKFADRTFMVYDSATFDDTFKIATPV